MIKNANRLTAIEAARLMDAQELSGEQLMLSCIERIKERNDLVHALVAFDENNALAQARAKDQEPRGPYLHGLPFVAKDVLDTVDFPTEYGSPIYKANQPLADSASVLRFKKNGAVLVGKAATSEFATRKPAATRNPLRPTHTPGGSSSGSAAAVADFMVPFALGTQSTGSLARPASYCGIVGFKPSFDLFNRAGLKAISQSQDTIGLLTRTIGDASFIAFNDIDFDDRVRQLAMPNFALCQSRQWQFADSDFHKSIAALVEKASDAGRTIPSLQLPAIHEELIAIQEKIFVYEACDALAYERLEHPHLISDILRDRLAFGDLIDQDAYLDFRRMAEQAKAAINDIFRDADVLIYPATESSAEEGIDYSGSPRFGGLWTLLHLPTVVIPFSRTPNGMPFGIQLIGRFAEDRKLLAAAHKLSSYFESAQEAAL